MFIVLFGTFINTLLLINPRRMRERVTVVILCVCHSVCPGSSVFISGLYTKIRCFLGFLQHFKAMWFVDFSKKASFKRNRRSSCHELPFDVRRPYCHVATPTTRTRGYRLRMRVLNIAKCMIVSLRGSRRNVYYCQLYVSDKAEGFALQCLILYINFYEYGYNTST